jgi:hypothetical protein
MCNFFDKRLHPRDVDIEVGYEDFLIDIEIIRSSGWEIILPPLRFQCNFCFCSAVGCVFVEFLGITKIKNKTSLQTNHMLYTNQ